MVSTIYLYCAARAAQAVAEIRNTVREDFVNAPSQPWHTRAAIFDPALMANLFGEEVENKVERTPARRIVKCVSFGQKTSQPVVLIIRGAIDKGVIMIAPNHRVGTRASLGRA
jgi:hypothetical protein